MNQNTYEIVTLIARLIVAVAVTYLIPQISKNLKDKKIADAVQKAVYAAQQTLWKEDGQERKRFAVKLATQTLEKAHIKITEEQLSSLIEAAVQEMHIAKGDYTKETETSAKIGGK